MNSKKELVKKPKAVAKPKPAKKTSVDKPKPAKKTSVDKPKAKPAKKASVAKPKPVAKPKAIRKVYVEQLNKKRNWKGGASDDDDIADANILIGILNEVKMEYLETFMPDPFYINVSKPAFIKFATHYFIKPGNCMFAYNAENMEYMEKNLANFGFPSTHKNIKQILALTSLFNIIKDIFDYYYYLYGVNCAFLNVIVNYKDDDHDLYYNQITYIDKIFDHVSHGSQSSIRNSEVSIDPTNYSNDTLNSQGSAINSSILASQSSQGPAESRTSSGSTHYV